MEVPSDRIINVPPGVHDFGLVRIDQPVRVVGTTPKLCTIRGGFVGNLGDSRFEHVTIQEMPGVASAIKAENCEFMHVHNCTLAGFDVAIDIQVGHGYVIRDNYIVQNKVGIRLKNVQEPDCGDGMIDGNTFDTVKPDSITACHFISGGGLHFTNNKVLGMQFGFLGEMEGVTSDLIIVNNSFEKSKVFGIAVRLNDPKGRFENVHIINNQFLVEVPLRPVVWCGDIARVIVDNLIFNCNTMNAVSLTNCSDSKIGRLVGAGG